MVLETDLANKLFEDFGGSLLLSVDQKTMHSLMLIGHGLIDPGETHADERLEAFLGHVDCATRDLFETNKFKSISMKENLFF